MVLQDLLQPPERALDEFPHQIFEGNIRPVRGFQLTEQAHGPDLVTFSKNDIPVDRKGGFHAAAADIHQQGHIFLQVDRFGNRQVDQAGFFLAADDFHRDAGGLQDAFHQNFLVGGLAHGTGGYRPELADAVIVHHLLEGGEGIDRFLHAGFADDAGAIFEGILAQPDGHAQAFEGFQVECVIHLAN